MSEHVDSDERATTRRMVRHLAEMDAQEPPQDAGGHPSIEVHERVGRQWAEWDKQRAAWRVLIAPRLLREALDDLACTCGHIKPFGYGPHICVDGRPDDTPPAPDDNEGGAAWHSQVGDVWTCGGCGTSAPAQSDDWRFTDAAWCPKCAWLA